MDLTVLQYEEGIVYDVLLKFKESEWLYNDEILEGVGIVDDMNRTIRFLLSIRPPE